MHAVKGIGKDHAKFQPVGKYIYNFIIDLYMEQYFNTTGKVGGGYLGVGISF